MSLFVGTHTEDYWPWWIFMVPLVLYLPVMDLGHFVDSIRRVTRPLSPYTFLFFIVLELATLDCLLVSLFCICVTFNLYSILFLSVMTCIADIFSTEFNTMGGGMECFLRWYFIHCDGSISNILGLILLHSTSSYFDSVVLAAEDPCIPLR